MRLAVTGSSGQVVSSLVEVAAGLRDIEIIPLGRPRCDLRYLESIKSAIEAVRPDVVVSAAAYTAADKAEDESDLAFKIIAEGAGAVASAAAGIDAPIIHLSTDCVIDGEATRPHEETDTPAPTSGYCATKLAGEMAVAAANPRILILRTAWVYSPYGQIFVKTILRLAADRPDISVVSDQWGNPTSAKDIANGILVAARQILVPDTFESYGLYNLVGHGEANWSGFARHILETSRNFGGPYAKVWDIASTDYPTKARRPANSRLSMGRFQATHAGDDQLKTSFAVSSRAKGRQLSKQYMDRKQRTAPLN